MVAIDLGTAYLNIVPSTRDIAPGVKAALGDSSATGRAADNAGKSIGGRLSGALTKTLKVGALTAGGAIVGTLGTALYKGFGRLQGIEQAEAKLTGLGHSTKGVEKIMKNALNAVRGTAFGMDEAATTAAGAVAAGIKPGKDLQKTLTLVGDAATIAGTDMGSMGAIFNKVAASNKIQGDVIAQLNDAGIPIVQLLGKELGKTSEETLKLASEGKVNFETFQKAMQKGLGGAAQESGKTVSGSFANMQAALGRLGASLLGGAFEKLPGILQNSTERLDRLGPVATKVGQAIGTGLSKAVDLANQAFAAVSPTLGKVAAWLGGLDWAGFGQSIATNVLPVVESVRGFLVDRLLPALMTLGEYLVNNVGPIVQQAFGIFRDQVLPILADLYGWLYDKVAPAVLDLAQKVGANLKPVFDALVQTFQAQVLPAVQQILSKFREWWPTIQQVLGVVGGLIAKLAEFVAKIVGAVLPVVIKLAGFLLKHLVSAILNGIEVTARIIGGLISFGKAIYNAGAKVVEFAKKVGTQIGKVITWFTKLPGKILNAVGNFGGTLVQSGKDLIQGLIDGAGSLLSKIGELFLNKVPGWIKGPFKKALGIASPSKVFKGYGKNLIEGLIKGVDVNSGKLEKSIERMADRIDKALKKKQIGKKAAAQMKAGLEQITKVASGLRDVLAQHAETVSSVASNLAGELSLADIFEGEKNVFGLSTGGGAASVAAGIANRMRAFAEKLAALVGTGLPGTLISEIAGYGSVKGSEIADKFLKLSQADRASIRSSYDLFQSSTQGAGLAVANATHGGGISAAQASLEAAIENGFKGVGIYVDATVGVTDDVAVQILTKAEKRKKKRK